MKKGKKKIRGIIIVAVLSILIISSLFLMNFTKIIGMTASIPEICEDGTEINTCSITKPLFCNEENKNLILNCFKCGCLGGQRCRSDGSCETLSQILEISTEKEKYYKDEIINLFSQEDLGMEIEEETRRFGVSSFYQEYEDVIYEKLGTKEITEDTQPIIHGYIVQFKSTSDIRSKKELLNSITGMFISREANIEKIKREHERFKEDLERLGINLKETQEKDSHEGKITGQPILGIPRERDIVRSPKIKGEWTRIFNGIVVDVTREEAEKIKKLSYVKNVFPNKEYYPFLYESVEQVKADKVWEIKDRENEFVTGKGVKIAVIDTGVNYMHSDFKVSESCEYWNIEEEEAYEAESEHPYKDDFQKVWEIKKPGYENIAIHFESLETEQGYDFVYVKDKDYNTIKDLTGIYEDFWVNVPGDSVKVLLKTGLKYEIQGKYTGRGYGFKIDKIAKKAEFNGDCTKVKTGYDFVENDGDVYGQTENLHGTHVAGIVLGVAPDAEVVSYRVCDSGCLESDIISAIEKAIDPNEDYRYGDKAHIISMSLGGMGDPWDALSIATDNAARAGSVVTVAAGNDGFYGEETISSPGTARNAITIGASCKPSQVNKNYYCSSNTPYISEFSSKGPSYIYDKPDVVAPGVDICSSFSVNLELINYTSPYSVSNFLPYTCINNQHIKMSGTSMATPHVAGAVALLLQKNPDWTPDDVKDALKKGASDYGYRKAIQGAGNIDVENSIDITQDKSGKLWEIPDEDIEWGKRFQ